MSKDHPDNGRGMKSSARSLIRSLHQFENRRRLGTLSRTSSGLTLAYDPEWLAWEGATPVSLFFDLRQDDPMP